MKRTQVKYHLAIVFNEKKKEIRQEYMKLKEKHDEIVQPISINRKKQKKKRGGKILNRRCQKEN